MADKETSRTFEARNGSTERIITSSNDSEHVLFGPTGAVVTHTPQPSKKVRIWEQTRLHIDPVSKLSSTLSSLVLVAWSVFLFVGGLNFLFYYGIIGFIPELDTKASITLLTTSASIGIVLFFIMSIVLIGPALSWLGVVKNKNLKSLWYDDGAEFPRRSAILWFILPLAIFSIASLLMVVSWQWLGDLSIYVGFPVSLGLIIIGTGWCLWRRLPDRLNSRDKWAAMGSVLSSTFLSIVIFLSLLVFVHAIVADDPLYKTYQTVWLVLIMGMVLASNTALVKATFLPVLKFLIAIMVILFLLSFYIPLPRLVSKASMNWFQFGNIQHASLILDEVGCNISRSHGLPVEKRVPDPKTCVLPDVMILSRLGTPYYIEMTGTPQKRLTIPAQNVLSWSVIESKKPPATGSPESAQNLAPRTGTSPSSP